MLSIGSFSRVGGVSPKALRLYESLGLFRPAWVDRDSGYRYYSAAQLPELRRIVALRDTGMPLLEIARALGEGRDLRTTLAERRAELERQRREIDRRLAALEIRVETAGEPNDPGADVVLRSVPREPVATLALSLIAGGDVAAAFYELESHVRDLGRRAHRPPGALIPERGDPPGTRVYVPLKGAIQATDRIGFEVLPTVQAVTTLHRGDYEGMSGTRRSLERWTAAAGFTRAGPLRVLYLQFGAESELRVPPGWVVERASDFLTELQLPVT